MGPSFTAFFPGKLQRSLGPGWTRQWKPFRELLPVGYQEDLEEGGKSGETSPSFCHSFSVTLPALQDSQVSVTFCAGSQNHIWHSSACPLPFGLEGRPMKPENLLCPRVFPPQLCSDWPGSHTSGPLLVRIAHVHQGRIFHFDFSIYI